MNVGSLFSGIGGFDLGLEHAGMRTVWFCEQDEFCQHVLAKHWPGVPCYPDITDLRGSDVEPVDVLCGGFPCQDLSVAGKGAGLDGERSGLWGEYARLIRELRPRYVIVENVSALLARGMGRVLGDLAACGYDAEWDCVPASAVGAPHRRDRVWLVAYPGGEGRREVAGGGRAAGVADAARLPEGRAGAESGAVGERAGTCGEPGRLRDVADAESVAVGSGLRPDESGGVGRGRLGDGGSADGTHDEGRALHNPVSGRHGTPEGPLRAGWDGTLDAGWWLVEPDVGRVAHGVPARVDRLRSLGNALVPQIAEWIGRQVMAYEEVRND